MSLFTRAFWEDFAERGIGTFAQAFIGALPIIFTNEIDWINALYVALYATLFFSLKAIVAVTINKETGASFGTTVPREQVRTIIDDNSPTEVSSDEGSDLKPGTPVFPEEPFKE